MSAGANPTQLVGGVLAILSMAALARHAVRRRLAGGVLGDRIEGGANPFGTRLARGLYRALVDLVGLGVFALVALALIA